MPNSSTSTIVGWTLAFVIYIIILIFGAYMLQSHNQKIVKYTANKKDLLNVTLVERKVKKVEKTKKKKKIVKKKTTVNKPKPVEKKKTVRAKPVEKKQVKPDFKKLFGKIKVDELPKESPKREQKVRKKVVQKEVEEVVKDEKAKKITKSLDFEKQESLIIAQNDGVYDEFRGKIADILDSHWQETIDTVSGNIAEVIIGVDKLGNFSYKIETLSYNDAFNAKLRDFLEEMRDIEFPPYKNGEIFNMKVAFKDILE
jgi:protein TonB